MSRIRNLCAANPRVSGRNCRSERVGRRRNAWLDNYMNRMVARDVRGLSRLAHLDRLSDLLRLLAANTSGELVKARVANDAGIPETSLPGPRPLGDDLPH